MRMSWYHVANSCCSTAILLVSSFFFFFFPMTEQSKTYQERLLSRFPLLAAIHNVWVTIRTREEKWVNE